MKNTAKIIPNVARMQIGKSASGTPSFNCGDTVATALQGLSSDQILDLAKKIGLNTESYQKMNPGHRRMVIGGSLRRRVRNQDELHKQNPIYIKTGEQWLNELVSTL